MRLDTTQVGRAQGLELAGRGWWDHELVCMMVPTAVIWVKGSIVQEAGQVHCRGREMRAYF